MKTLTIMVLMFFVAQAQARTSILDCSGTVATGSSKGTVTYKVTKSFGEAGVGYKVELNANGEVDGQSGSLSATAFMVDSSGSSQNNQTYDIRQGDSVNEISNTSIESKFKSSDGAPFPGSIVAATLNATGNSKETGLIILKGVLGNFMSGGSASMNANLYVSGGSGTPTSLGNGNLTCTYTVQDN